jgi:hypothetical protein
MHSSRSEEGFYWQIMTGYATEKYSSDQINATNDRLHSANFGFAGGYKINKMWALDLGLEEVYEWENTKSIYANGEMDEEQVKLHLLHLEPGVRFQAGRGKVKFYSKTGPDIIFPIYSQEFFYSVRKGVKTVYAVNSYPGAEVSYDYTFTVGAQYSFGTRFAAFAGVKICRQFPFRSFVNYIGNANTIGLNAGLHISLGKRFWVDKSKYDLGG